MPKIWIEPSEAGTLLVTEYETQDGMPVEMNASLLRQIKAANKQYSKFQGVLNKFYMEAVQHSKTVRRVR